MKWFTNYKEDLELAFNQAEEILSEFPEEFRSQALKYLDRFNPSKRPGSQNYICYLLPFWLQEAAGTQTEDSRRLTVAMIFVMMYYHLVDEVMDEPETKENKRKLPLANLIQLEFWRIYTTDYPPCSSFWNYYRKYMSEWAQAVAFENENDFFQTNPVGIANKAAPVKLTVAGALLLTGREERIADFESAVDTVLMTLQMLDDWEDWEKDLQEGSYNALISVVQRELQIPSDRRPTPEEIKHALYVRDILFTYAIQTDHNTAILAKTADELPHLQAFHEYLKRSLKDGAQSLQKERNLLTQGGLAYWLTKNETHF
ncbi:hypothetical protein [Paenibacillus sanguinis]|uniref:hypothetical protein n=1 Tax=Paenibacillus sanguinis TaxID=225906 RepID=UPI00038280A0|nr:hypothetical protein [Paenibacillus sanguinis]